jgi:hypothetical protein
MIALPPGAGIGCRVDLDAVRARRVRFEEF